MYNNKRESERLNRGSKSGGHHDLSFYSGVSCPSPARPDADQPCYSSPPAYVDGGAQHSRWHKRDEYIYHDEQIRSFESNRFGEETYNYHDYHWRSFDTSRSGGQCWLNGSRSAYSSHGQLSSSSSEADVSYCSTQSSDDGESEMRRITHELNRKMDMYNACQEKLNMRARDIHLSPADQKHILGGTSLSEETIKGKRIGSVLGATQTSESVVTLQEIMKHPERESTLVEEEKRKFLESVSKYIQYKNIKYIPLRRLQRQQVIFQIDSRLGKVDMDLFLRLLWIILLLLSRFYNQMLLKE